jgi:hypothetical protein
MTIDRRGVSAVLLLIPLLLYIMLLIGVVHTLDGQ